MFSTLFRRWCNTRLLLPILALLAAPGLPAAQAGFQTTTLQFNISNEFGPGDYGQITINADTSTGTVTMIVNAFTSVYSSTDPKAFGIDQFGFNFSPSLTLDPSQVSVNKGGWTTTIDPANHISEFGKFDAESDGTGVKDRVDPLVITITGLGADAIISNFEFLSTDGNPDAYFVAHVAGFNYKDQSSHFIAVTDLTPVNPVPAPPAIALALLGIGGLGVYRWRRQSKPAH
jgi:hypothetical protein